MHLLTTESGMTAKQLAAMSRRQLGDYLYKNDKFAAALARLKYASSPGRIPGTIEDRARYWSKYYQGTNNPRKQEQYISDNQRMSEEVKASSISRVLGRHMKVMRPTYGMVQKLHKNKIGHNIASTFKKLAMRGL